MAPAQTAKADTRTRIIDAARELFHANGFQATTMAEILAKSGVNSGSLYYFFKSKDELLLAVLDSYVDLMWPLVMEPAFGATDDPIERIFTVLDGYRQLLAANSCAIGCPIGNLALELVDARPEIREKISLNFSNWCEAIRRCLGEAADRLPPDLDQARLSRFVLTVMEGGIMQARGHRRIEPYEEAVAQLRDYFNLLLESRAGDRARRSGSRN